MSRKVKKGQGKPRRVKGNQGRSEEVKESQRRPRKVKEGRSSCITIPFPLLDVKLT